MDLRNRNSLNSPTEYEPSEEPPVKDNQYNDVGNHASDHYKSRLSPIRYKIRSAVIPWIRKETDLVYKLQTNFRTPVLDYYFAWSACLASHTFYVLMLPLPIWLGGSNVARDLVYVLGFGIFITGNFKDYLCLPRPRSPPIHRITMSSYTTQEYGFPSSHSANATAVTLILLWKVIQFRENFTSITLVATIVSLLTYYISLIFGRLYCGMHGFIDIMMGSLIGIVCFSFRFFLGEAWDNWLLKSHNDSFEGLIFTPVFIICSYLLMIHFHSAPVDDCPCFDDSVAFIGVLIGLDLSHWMCNVTQYLTTRNEYNDPMLIAFNFENLGFVKTILRLATGIIIVVIWKFVSKPVIFTILPPIYKFVGVYLPRSHFTSTAHSHESTRSIRRQSISNMDGESISEFLKGVAHQDKVDKVGPENDADYYEMLAYKDTQEDKIDPPPLSGVFKPRYDVEIVGRLVIYAGISTTAIWAFEFTSKLVGLV